MEQCYKSPIKTVDIIKQSVEITNHQPMSEFTITKYFQLRYPVTQHINEIVCAITS